MKKTLVWEILTHLSKKDRREFNVFLASPFFNHREDIIAIYCFLRKNITEDRRIPSKEKVFNAAYPNERYDDKEMGLLLSYLHKVLEEYLWIQEARNTSFKKETFLITAYRKKKMNRNFTRTLKKTDARLIQQPLRNPAHYFTRFELEQQAFTTLVERGQAKEYDLGKSALHLDFACLSLKLQEAFSMLSHKAIIDWQYDSTFLEQVMALAQQEAYKDAPPIALYHQFIILFQEGGIKEFIHFKVFLFQQAQYFTKTEFKGVYLMALNFCIKKVNDNHPDFYAATFDMYKKGIEMELLLESEKITPFTFSNIVGIAIQQNELEWTENFIQANQNYLDDEHKETILSLNKARLAFAKKNFEKALLFLQNVDNKNIFNHMISKVLQLKIYYELNETDSLNALIASLRIFISRKKEMSYHYQIWKNILYYTQKISDINPYDKKAVKLLIGKIKSEKILPEREWLLTQLKKG